MTSHPGAICAICLRLRRADESWFVLRENRWTDRLQIMRWHDELLARPGMYPVCGVGHVQQLVVHWMTTGNVDYPFSTRPGEVPASSAVHERCPGPDTELEMRNAEILGELAVDRDSIGRILVENPELMACLISALGDALLPHTHTCDTALEVELQDEAYALMEV